MRIPDLELYKGMPDSTIIYSADMFEIFGYKLNRNSSVTYFIRNGSFPSPSKINFMKLKGCKANTKYVWSLGDLRKLQKELIEASNNATTR